LEWLSSQFDTVARRAQRGYRNVPIDEDAQILRNKGLDGRCPFV